jgi:glycosyltransferase involved in cell wall biosynthesis
MQTEGFLFSIVVPCYETPEPYLRECLQSAIDQTEPAWEAIVVDDASASLDVEAAVSRMSDRRFRVIRHPENRGEAASRNSGIRAAQGGLIVPLDADDRLAPEFLQKTKAALDATPGADWILTDRQLFGASADVLRYPSPLPIPCPIHFNAQSPGLLSRRLWEAIGGYSEEDVFRSGGADLDFWISAVERGAVVGHVPEPLYLWRIHSGSASQNSFRYNNHLIHRALYDRHRELFHSFLDRCPRCRGRRSLREYLSSGYLAAADASIGRGQRMRAVGLSVRALVRDPGGRAVRQLAKSLTPAPVVRIVRAIRGNRFSDSQRARHRSR